MAHTKSAFAFGGITHCFFCQGLSSFFLEFVEPSRQKWIAARTSALPFGRPTTEGSISPSPSAAGRRSARSSEPQPRHLICVCAAAVLLACHSALFRILLRQISFACKIPPIYLPLQRARFPHPITTDSSRSDLISLKFAPEYS